MNIQKIKIVIGREFLTRVKKRSFIFTTLLIPLMLAGMMMLYVWLFTLNDEGQKEIVVIDKTGLISPFFSNTEELFFRFQPQEEPADYREHFDEQKIYAVVHIDASMLEEQRPRVMIYSTKQVNPDIQRNIRTVVEKAVQEERIKKYNIDNLEEILQDIRVNAQVRTMVWSSSGEEKESEVGIYMIISMVFGLIIYMFIFMFGSLVMRGVMEEKSSRIVEVIISSVKPIELMMGKIIGIACVALLQFAIWISLTVSIITIAQAFLGGGMPDQIPVGAGQVANMTQEMGQSGVNTIFDTLSLINFPLVIAALVCYFLLGYLLYASMFAAIGAAGDSESDMQQLTLPVTLPLILGMMMMMHTFQHPDSALSFWGSMIPFTSPMIMMARISFGVPGWQLVLSLLILVSTFVGIAYFAAKIYRVGILMYGKKVSWKELWKWMRYKN